MNAFKVFSPTRPIGPVYLNTIPHIYIIALIVQLICYVKQLTMIYTRNTKSGKYF